MLAIAVTLSVYSALVLSLVSSLFFSVAPSVHIADVFGFAAFLCIFTFIVISACIGFIILPIILIGQRTGRLITLRSALILSCAIGSIVCLVTTGWYLGEGWGWLLLLFLGASTGVLGGYLWWRWIGFAETHFKLQKVEHLL